jgi:hypothetical protein
LRALRPKKKSELVGVGCLVQGAGLLSPFVLYEVVGTIGIVAGVVLMVVLLLIGSRMALKWICPACANPLASKDVMVCPSCQVEFE